jgi:alkanesulfonate monooxygenase SsuD/methylene tetrahydromethanopterin reductase-like flavin-dependent oxidoreductase (luciferase family)
MKFGLFYEHQLPRPWTEESELRLYDDTLAQVELADRLGIDYVWSAEHHFLEEHSHSPAPEVFLAACAQRTRRIRLGHGVMVMIPPYNHPVRAAERIATLDLISHGRVEWGTGESSAVLETEGFVVDREHKRAMWEESVEQAANMLSMTPYPGFKGEHFEMPCRNVIPKPYQKPHPPLWLGCSRRETIHRAARHGLGVLTFGFVEPEQAAHWVEEYYDIIKSDECVPIGRTVNANFAVVCAFSVHEDEATAFARAVDGFRFFGYTLGWASSFGRHRPGRSNLWSGYSDIKDSLPQAAGTGAVGTPDQVRDHLERYERVGVDQVIFAQQYGRNRHEDICDSLRLFARTMLPEFRRRDEIRQREKAAELRPHIARAERRKPAVPELSDADVPTIEALGVRTGVATADASRSAQISDRGGGIPIPKGDPHGR